MKRFPVYLSLTISVLLLAVVAAFASDPQRIAVLTAFDKEMEAVKSHMVRLYVSLSLAPDLSGHSGRDLGFNSETSTSASSSGILGPDVHPNFQDREEVRLPERTVIHPCLQIGLWHAAGAVSQAG